MPEFGDFERALDRALRGEIEGLKGWWSDPVAGAAGLSVYRNTVAKGAVDALRANYPTVERVGGCDWFRVTALRFGREHPPMTAALADYGDAFPDWLVRHAAGLPYLSDLARLDVLWRQALFAADAPVLTAEGFVGELAELRAVLHPSLRLARFDWNAPALWRLNQLDEPPAHMTLEPSGAEVAILRPHQSVEVHPLAPGGYALLLACAEGRTLGEAALAATAAGGDVASLLSGLILAGAFTQLRKPS